jgi:phosphatidate phosphatase LPIN
MYIYNLPSDIELDAVGYHSQHREPSDHTITDGHRSQTPSLPSGSRPHTPSVNHEQPTTTDDAIPYPATPISPRAPPQSLSREHKPSLKSPVPIHFPTTRSTSEPPFDAELDGRPLLQVSGDPNDPISVPNGLGLSISPPVQEYSWEWGAFPQPSPLKTSYKDPRWDTIGKAKTKGKTRLPMVLVSDGDEMATREEDGDVEETRLDRELMRSRSVPPGLDGSPSMKRKELKGGGEFGYGDVDVDAEVDGVLDRLTGDLRGEHEDHGAEGSLMGTGFGAGGRLTASSRDPTRIGAFIEGKTVQFELSLVDDGGRDGGIPKIFDGHDEVEAARLFEQGKVDYRKFLDDETVAKDERLVIRWAGDQ